MPRHKESITNFDGALLYKTQLGRVGLSVVLGVLSLYLPVLKGVRTRKEGSVCNTSNLMLLRCCCAVAALLFDDTGVRMAGVLRHAWSVPERHGS